MMGTHRLGSSRLDDRHGVRWVRSVDRRHLCLVSGLASPVQRKAGRVLAYNVRDEEDQDEEAAFVCEAIVEVDTGENTESDEDTVWYLFCRQNGWNRSAGKEFYLQNCCDKSRKSESLDILSTN